MDFAQNKHSSNRIDWIDCAKGIAILTVIAGHTLQKTPQQMIFSFHMPLFFILAGITYKPAENTYLLAKRTYKSFRQLILPAIIMYLLSPFFGILTTNWGEFWRTDQLGIRLIDSLLTIFFASGSEFYLQGHKIISIGASWFMFALFELRLLFDFLNLKLRKPFLFTACIGLSLCGILVSKYQWLPFSFDIVLAILPFFLIGTRSKYLRIEKNPVQKLILFGAIWYISFHWIDRVDGSFLEFAVRRYPVFPICYITAVAGSLAICELSVLCTRLKTISSLFIYLGRYSLHLLCIHIVDYLWMPLFMIEGQEYISSFLRIATIICVLLLFNYLCKTLFHKSNTK